MKRISCLILLSVLGFAMMSCNVGRSVKSTLVWTDNVVHSENCEDNFINKSVSNSFFLRDVTGKDNINIDELAEQHAAWVSFFPDLRTFSIRKWMLREENKIVLVYQVYYDRDSQTAKRTFKMDDIEGTSHRAHHIEFLLPKEIDTVSVDNIIARQLPSIYISFDEFKTLEPPDKSTPIGENPW